ncbi:MBL fold metallo-hydrolase [Jannaschia sp. Os4]|uniref:MBL fold metallo-hydrolase n=1 Tax=Jannaschia sp. Os4 TaxID=2807617 RepID=UPI00193A6EC5|nr:MBL fold metallo-hydrolase [Jannaschia sp. Os4]MBM2576553.1 MBL fold metallo-hydrolase [Jannaschia sp. Os4]
MPPRYGAPEEVGSGVRRVLCPNPSPMTEAGTNAYVLHDAGEAVVVDPGPDLPEHRAALLAAVEGMRVAAVVVTHPHLDHSPGARPLGDAVGAPVLAFGPPEAGRSSTMRALAGIGGGEGVDDGFAPDEPVADGAEIRFGATALRALWTPGHMASHIALHWPDRKVAFTGDVVMGWASTMISPPDGDLGQFMASLDRMEALGAITALPGHGGAVPDLAARCRALRDHRRARERQVLDALAAHDTVEGLVGAIYADVAPALHPAAARNVLAHLIHLREAGRVEAVPGVGLGARWRRA